MLCLACAWAVYTGNNAATQMRRISHFSLIKLLQTADLQFNIIFTPYTVRYLKPFIASLLKWSDCRYRLVANALSSEDKDQLIELADQHDRLEFIVLSETGPIEHGKALRWLQERTESPWFCFMDSDIIATGPFLDQVAERLEHCDVISSGVPYLVCA